MSRLACAVCATPAVPGARFCFNCGAPLERPADFGDASAERRLVTVLFGDLSDFTAWAEDLDPERVGVVTDRVLAGLATAVTDVGGHVDKLTGDGIMAVFGAPTMHEDDAERAVRAAAQMQASLRRLVEEEAGGGRRMGLRVGLNTGEVLAGIQANMAYTVVGDTVNTASRLADAAAVGTVYAGRETAMATMSTASWRALTPLRLKGKREPVPAYELLGLRPPGAVRLGVGDEAPFVGREAELGMLVGRLHDVEQRGRPATVVVTGEAGVGKSRLAAEITRLATDVPDQRVLWGRCPPYGTGRALAPIAEWVRTACGIGENESAEQAAERIRRTLARLDRPAAGHPPVPAGVADWLLALLGITATTPSPREATAPGATTESGDPLLDAVLALLGGLAAAGPLLLVVDDLQWGTPELVGALSTLLQAIRGPVLLVCLGRSDVLADGDLPDDWWADLPDPELLPVTPLDDAAAGRLLRAYLGGGELDPAAQSLLIDRAQGNPFFLAELLHLLVDRDVLRATDHGWRLDGDLPTDMLPAGVQSVLAARFDGLDPVAKAVLRDAAVVGTRFAASTLHAVDPRPDEEIEFALGTLDARGIVRQVGDSDEGPATFEFAHTLARDVIYAAIPKAERARRHAVVATWAAGAMPGPRGEADAFVAAQAERAAELAEEMRLPADDPAWQARQSGFAALTRLGQAALYRGDNTRADLVFSRALLVGGADVPEEGRAPVLTGRAAARAALHRREEAEQDLAGPLQARDLGVRAAALVVQGELRRQRGDDQAARQSFVSALAMASDAGVDRVTGEALRQLGMIDYLDGRLQSAEQRFRQALELAERVGDDHGVGWAFQHLAWSATTRGDWALAEETLARAGEVFAAVDDTGGLSWCAGTEAFIRLLQGRFHETREVAGALIPLGVGDPWGLAACRTIDAFAAAELGHIEEARAEARAAYDGFVALADTWGKAMALTAWGAAERGAGRPEQAIGVLEDAVACSEAAKHVTTEALALGALGYCRLDLGDAAGAEHDACRALDRVGGMDLEAPAFVGPTVLLAQAWRAQGRLDEALALLLEAAASTDAPSLIFPRRQALAHCAGALLEAGRAAEALAMIRRAFEVPAQDVRSRIVALRVLGNCYLACGDAPAARYALRQALALARSTQQVSEVPATERTAQVVGI